MESLFVGFKLLLSFYHPFISHISPSRLALHVVPIPWGAQSLVVSKNYDNAKNKEENGALTTQIMCCLNSDSSKSPLFQFTLVAALTLRTLERVRALYARKWRLKEGKLSSVRPRMPSPLFLGVTWRTMSSKSSTASEMKPSVPLVQQCSGVSLGDAADQTHLGMDLFTA